MPPCSRPFVDGPGVELTVRLGQRNALGGDARDEGACDVLRCGAILGLAEGVSGEIQDFTPTGPNSGPYGPNYCIAVTRDAAQVQLISFDGESGVFLISFGGTTNCGEAWRVRFLDPRG